MEILTAYVRAHAPWKKEEQRLQEEISPSATQLPVFSANNIPVHVRETGWQSPVGAALLADEEAQSAR
jgi:hypothetical protein